MWNLWFLFLNFVAIIIGIVALPEGKIRSMGIVFLLLSFTILVSYTLIRSVPLKGLLTWIQAWRNLGIRGMYHRGDERNKELFNRISHSRNLKIMALSAESLIRHSKDAISTALAKKNCNVKVLIAQGESDFVKEVETLEGPDRRGQISTEIKHTRTRLEEIIRLAKEKSQYNAQSIGHIWITTYNTALRSSLIICDNSWGWHSLNLAPKRAIETLSFELKKVPNGLLQDCIRHFDAVWKMHRKQIQEIT